MTELSKPNLWALLSAAECCPAPAMPGAQVYSGLRRPANDVALMDAFLGTMLHAETTIQLAVLNACEGSRTSRHDPIDSCSHS